jgi:hypothetical protein
MPGGLTRGTRALALLLLVLAPRASYAQLVSQLTVAAQAGSFSGTLALADLDRGYVCYQMTATVTAVPNGNGNAKSGTRTDTVWVYTTSTSPSFPVGNPASYTKAVSAVRWTWAAAPIANGANGTPCDGGAGWPSIFQGTPLGTAPTRAQYALAGAGIAVTAANGQGGNGATDVFYVYFRVPVGYTTDPGGTFPAVGAATLATPTLAWRLNGP